MNYTKHLEQHIQKNKHWFFVNQNIQKTYNQFSQLVEYKDQEIVFALNIKPFTSNKQNSHIADFGPKGIVRCSACKAYMNPFNLITQKNKYYICAICKTINSIPEYYKIDYERPQLSQLSYLIKPGPNQFVINQKVAPYIILLIQVSSSFIESQLFSFALSSIKNSLQNMNPEQNILLITYNDLNISYYNLEGQEPIRYVLSDDQKPFKIKSCTLESCKDKLIYILQNLSSQINKSIIKQKVLIKKATEYAISLLLKIGGKIFHIFQNQVQYKQPQGDLNNKKSYLDPNNPYYQNLSNLCCKNNISYLIFLFSKHSSNLVNLTEITRATSGNVYFYGYDYQSYIKLYYDLYFELTKQVAFSTVNRVRMNCTAFEKKKDNLIEVQLQSDWRIKYLNEITLPGQLVNICNIDYHKVLTVQIQLMKNTSDKYLIIQNSTSFITPTGNVLISVENLVIELTPVIKSIHMSYDYQNLMFYYMRKILSKMIETRSPKVVKEYILMNCKNMKRLNIDWVKSILIFSLAILKNKLFLDITPLFFKKTIEQRWVRIINCLYLNSTQLFQIFIPALMQLDLDCVAQYSQTDGFIFPQKLSLHKDSIDQNKLYLLDCGYKIMILLVDYESQYQMLNNILSSDQDHYFTKLIQQLKLLRSNKYLPISFVNRHIQSDDYLEFTNYLIYSKGTLEFHYDYQEFLNVN